MLYGPDDKPIRASGDRPVLREIAGIGGGRDITRPYLEEVLRPLDDILRTREHTLAGYKRVLSDWQVYTAFQQRRRAVTSREWEVTPGGSRRADKKAADWLTEQLQGLGWDDVVDKMLFGVFFGYAVGELLFARDGRHVGVEAVRVRDRERFRFDPEFRLRLLTTRDPYKGEELPLQNFWVFSTGSDHSDDPYGMGLAHWLYWPVFFKRHGMGYWLKNLERWAQPVPHGKYAPGTPLHEQQKLLHTLHALQHDAGVVTPEGMDISLLEAKRSGTADYSTLDQRMDDAIAKVVNSQTMTTDSKSAGLGSGQAEVHERVALAVQRSDAALVCGSFNGGGAFGEGPVERLMRWNFPDAALPQVWYLFHEDQEDLGEAVETDTKVYNLGFTPSDEYVQKKYGPHWTRRLIAQPIPAPPAGGALPPAGTPADRLLPPARFSEAVEDPDPAGTVAAYAAQAALQSEAWDRLMGPVEELLARATSLEEVRDGLTALYAEMDASQLARVLQRALLSAELAGRFEVTNEEA